MVRAIRRLRPGSESKQEQTVLTFYNCLRLINHKRGRKYMNKRILMSDYMTRDGLQEEMPDLIEKITKEAVVSVDELLRLMRQMLLLFLKEVSVCSVLTSRRISSMSKKAHLERRRIMLKEIGKKRIPE